MLRCDYAHLKVLDDVFLQCRYYGKYKSNGIKGFILEYCDGLNLYETFNLHGGFPGELIKEIMKYVFGSLYSNIFHLLGLDHFLEPSLTSTILI